MYVSKQASKHTRILQCSPASVEFVQAHPKNTARFSFLSYQSYPLMGHEQVFWLQPFLFHWLGCEAPGINLWQVSKILYICMWRVGELLVHAHESTPMKSTSTRWLSWNQPPWYEVNSHQINFPRGQLLIKVANGIWHEMWQCLNVTTHETTVQSCREEHNHPPDIAANQVLVTIGKMRKRACEEWTQIYNEALQDPSQCGNRVLQQIRPPFWHYKLSILVYLHIKKLLSWEVDLVGSWAGGSWPRGSRSYGRTLSFVLVCIDQSLRCRLILHKMSSDFCHLIAYWQNVLIIECCSYCTIGTNSNIGAKTCDHVEWSGYNLYQYLSNSSSHLLSFSPFSPSDNWQQEALFIISGLQWLHTLPPGHLH